MLLEQTFTGWILGAECRTSMKAEEDNECRKLKLETSESHRLGCLPKKRVQRPKNCSQMEKKQRTCGL
ncbi:hypothetical protein TB2_040019 [Malus domestica]